MTSSKLPSWRPPHAVTIWSDNQDVYAEIPCVDGGHPHIMKFPLCEAGLSKVLWLLRQRKEQKASNYTGPKDPGLSSKKSKVIEILKFSEHQRESTRLILKDRLKRSTG